MSKKKQGTMVRTEAIRSGKQEIRSFFMKETVPMCPPLKKLAKIPLQHYASLIYMCLLSIDYSWKFQTHAIAVGQWEHLCRALPVFFKSFFLLHSTHFPFANAARSMGVKGIHAVAARTGHEHPKSILVWKRYWMNKILKLFLSIIVQCFFDLLQKLSQELLPLHLKGIHY